MAYIREDEATITLTVTDSSGNKRTISSENASWATYEGAELSAAGTKTRPGGMGKQTSEGGPATRSDTTLTVQQDDVILGQHSFLEGRVGKGKCVVTVQYLDTEGASRTGKFQVFGTLKQASLGGQNYDSPNIVMYTVVIDSDE